MKDLETKEDLIHLVDWFYDAVIEDKDLAPFFSRLNFEKHKPKMVQFWAFVLLDEAGYTTNVVEKHLNMPIQQIHLDRWISLFKETLDTHFSGEKKEIAKQRAEWLGWTILEKVKQQNTKP